MKIQITSGKHPKWYTHKVGNIYEVIEEMDENYLVHVPKGIPGAVYGVLKTDAKIHKEQTKAAPVAQKKLF